MGVSYFASKVKAVEASKISWRCWTPESTQILLALDLRFVSSLVRPTSLPQQGGKCQPARLLPFEKFGQPQDDRTLPIEADTAFQDMSGNPLFSFTGNGE